MQELLIISLLLTKHFVVDFPLQTKYQWSNKGTYLHPGGILHSGLQGLGTALVFLMFTPWYALFGLMDFLLHYHIDWAKMNLNEKLGYGPLTHEKFWWLLGLDQWLHQATYVGLVAFHVANT